MPFYALDEYRFSVLIAEVNGLLKGLPTVYLQMKIVFL